MPRKTSTGIRKPMSPESRARIAAAVKAAADKKRAEQSTIISTPTTLQLVRMKDVSFDPSIFTMMRTGNPIDEFFTVEGGLPKATNYMVIGDPGVGKSTVCLDIISDLITKGHRCLFVSAEMNRVEFFHYTIRYPKFAEVQTLFLGEYSDHDPRAILHQTFSLGFDIVLLDSFVEIQETIQEFVKCSGVAAKKWIVDSMAHFNISSYTSFLIIQQVTKDGVFVGSNSLKHITTGMLELRYSNPRDLSSTRYMEFTKNRRGVIGQRLNFSLISEAVSYEPLLEGEISE
jgi:predicted ATP-dependent serine protease